MATFLGNVFLSVTMRGVVMFTMWLVMLCWTLATMATIATLNKLYYWVNKPIPETHLPMWEMLLKTTFQTLPLCPNVARCVQGHSPHSKPEHFKLIPFAPSKKENTWDARVCLFPHTANPNVAIWFWGRLPQLRNWSVFLLLKKKSQCLVLVLLYTANPNISF